MRGPVGVIQLFRKFSTPLFPRRHLSPLFSSQVVFLFFSFRSLHILFIPSNVDLTRTSSSVESSFFSLEFFSQLSLSPIFLLSLYPSVL